MAFPTPGKRLPRARQVARLTSQKHKRRLSREENMRVGRRPWARCLIVAHLGLALALLIAGASSAPAADPLRIGLSLSLTGPTAAAGKQVLAGLEIWRDDVNNKGGLMGRPVQLVYYDDQGNPGNAP